MADRYWVGGTGTWDGTAGTKWATTSGGTGGASVPGGSDDVYFNAASGAAVVSIGAVNSRSIICTGFTGSFTGSSQVAVYGGLTLSATMTHTNTLQYIFAATSGTWTVTTAGKTIGGNTNFGNGASTATWTLGDNFTSTATINILYGTFNTNNFAVTSAGFDSSNTNVRAINLGSSTLTLNGSSAWNTTGIINLTFNAGTSTINITSNSTPTFNGGGLTFYNVSYTGGGTSTATITGAACTFNNLSVTANATGTRGLNFAANHTINGSLTTVGTTATQRVQFGSSPAGTQRTLSVATIGTLTNTDFRDITLTGAASPWTAPFGVGDLGNNSGITFNTQTAYWIGGTGNVNDGTKWSLSSGGSAANGIPQSTNSVVFDANSDAGSAFAVTWNVNWSVNNYTVTTPDFLMTAQGAGTLTVYGNWSTPATNYFRQNDGSVTFAATTTGKTITTNGVQPAVRTNWAGVGGAWTLQDNFTCNLNICLFNAGTLNTNGFTVTLNELYSQTTGTKVLNLGSSTVNLLNFDYTGSNLTVNAGTSTINCNGGPFNAGAGLTFYNVTLSNNKTITGTNTYNNLTLNPPASAGVTRFFFSNNQTVNGTFSAIGLNGDRRVGVFSNDFITQRTITAAAVSLTDVNFNEIVGAGAATWSGTRLSNGGGNSGITFDTAKTVYWNLVAGGSYFSNAWATSSGGTPATTNHPLGQDTAIIENTGLNSGATITGVVSGSILPNLTFATRTLPMTFNIGDNPYAPGNITLSSAVTRTGTQRIYFSGNTTLTMAGSGIWTNAIAVSGILTIADSVTMSGGAYDVYAGGTLTLNAPLTISAFTITNSGGTINLNSHTLTALGCTINNTPTINFGTGSINLTGTGGWNASGATFTGTSNIIIGTQSGAVTFAGGGLTYSKLTLGNNTNSTAQVTIIGSNTFGEISSNAFGGVLLLTAGTTQQVDRFTYAGYKDTPYNIAGGFLTSTSTTPANLTTPPAEYYGNFNGNAQYLNFSEISLAGNFTIECWVYPLSTGGMMVASGSSGADPTQIFRLNFPGSGYISYQNGSNIAVPGGIVANQWQHLALVRTGSSVSVYVNGVSKNTSSFSNTFKIGVIAGYGVTSILYFNGRISNFRVIDGTALYTSNFTPPVGNLTAVSGTQLLTLQSATIVDNSTNAFTITNTGSVTITQTTPFTRPFNTNYLKVSYVNVTPSNTWNALNSLSVIGTNTGWTFSGYPGNYGYTDIGVPIENKYVTKDYVMDYYPDLLPNFVTPQLFTWGFNSSGQLGDGTTTNRSSPGTTVTGGTNWKQVTANGYGHMAAIKTDGTLWTCGYNRFGILGDGTTTNRSSPGTTAGGGTNWKQVSSGFYHSAAIKTDGTLWTWGYNFTGRLGDGTTTNRSSPGTTAGGGTNWKQVTCAYYNTAAIKTDGTLWTWGHNNFGQLGDGTAAGRNSPGTVAGGGTNWKQVAGGYMHITAIKTDGTLWTWGNNSNGALGDGTTTSRSSPGTTASGGTNWKQIAGGNAYTSAIKTDGTLWMWGGNSSGQLGDGTTTNRSSPGTTAGSGTNWKQVSCGNSYTAAIKTDGTLWTWGINTQGQLGDGTTTSRRSPVTIAGGGTNWKQVSGYDFTAAISESEGW